MDQAQPKPVLDSNHGIEIIDYGLRGKGYLPWYTQARADSRHGYVSNYYTTNAGWKRVEYPSWLAAYDHIARSRGLPTSKQVGSTYVQEARNAGVELPEVVPTSAIHDEDPWYHPRWDNMPELEQEW